MSRTYLLEVDFVKEYTNDKIVNFFEKWCGAEQILRIEKSYIWVEMGCSGGVDPWDAMDELYKQLIKANFKVNREGIFCWSLDPDEAINLEDLE